jgi:capsule polysaccharide export protein KpsE/RkpR
MEMQFAADTLFTIIVVGIIAHFCFWGRRRYVTNTLFVIVRGHCGQKGPLLEFVREVCQIAVASVRVSCRYLGVWSVVVAIASVLFTIIVVGIIAHFCFWGRRRYVTNTLFVIVRGH